MELESPPVHISPEGGDDSRSPLDDGDNDPVAVHRHMSARYTNLLAQLNAAGSGVKGGSSRELLRGVENDEQEGVEVGSSAQSHPYMPGFGQAADTLLEEVGPMVTMADSGAAAYASRPRRESSSSPDPAIWSGGKDPSVLSSAHGHSSSAQGNHGTSSANKRSSYGYDDDPYAAYPLAGPSSPFLGSSSSEIGLGSPSVNKGSLSSRRRSIDKWQGSKEFVATAPTSYGLRNRSNSEPNSLKSILDRLRGAGSSSSPEPMSAPDVVVQDLTSPPPSATGSTFPPLFSAVVIRPPTPPSSLLRPISPQISNRPSPSALYDVNRPWPSIGILPPPSPAISDHSEGNIAEGLLDPQLPWRLEQARVDSSVSLRDNEDYSRPIGARVRSFCLLLLRFLN